MKIRTQRSLTVGLAVAVLCGAGCAAEEYSSLTLDGVRALVVDELTGACSWDENLYSGGSLFDAQISSTSGVGLYQYVQLTNNLITNEDVSANRLNTNRIEVIEFQIEYERDGAWAFLPEGRIDPAGVLIDSGGVLYAGVNLIDSAIATTMANSAEGSPSPVDNPGEYSDLLVRIRAKGQLLDGTILESNDIAYQVTVCNGCLIGACGNGVVRGCAPAQANGFVCGDPLEEPPVD